MESLVRGVGRARKVGRRLKVASRRGSDLKVTNEVDDAGSSVTCMTCWIRSVRACSRSKEGLRIASRLGHEA